MGQQNLVNELHSYLGGQSLGASQAWVQMNGFESSPKAMHRLPWHSSPAWPSPVATQQPPIGVEPDVHCWAGMQVGDPLGTHSPAAVSHFMFGAALQLVSWVVQESLHIFTPPKSRQLRYRHSESEVQQ